MKAIFINVVVCVFIEIIAGLIMPEGKMKGFCLSVLGLCLFYSIVFPLCEYLNGVI